MAKPLASWVTNPATPYDASRAIAAHQADFKACHDAAWECRKWAMEYLAAAYFYDEAAKSAAWELQRALELKWAMEEVV